LIPETINKEVTYIQTYIQNIDLPSEDYPHEGVLILTI
jgi:hypothetical protein